VKMLVDTGSTYIVLNPETLKELGLLETPYIADLLLADRRKIRAKLLLAEVEIKRRRGPAFVAELNVPTPLLGEHALETLDFKVNPRAGELEEISPEGGYLLQTTNPARPQDHQRDISTPVPPGERPGSPTQHPENGHKQQGDWRRGASLQSLQAETVNTRTSPQPRPHRLQLRHFKNNRKIRYCFVEATGGGC